MAIFFSNRSTIIGDRDFESAYLATMRFDSFYPPQPSPSPRAACTFFQSTTTRCLVQHLNSIWQSYLPSTCYLVNAIKYGVFAGLICKSRLLIPLNGSKASTVLRLLRQSRGMHPPPPQTQVIPLFPRNELPASIPKLTQHLDSHCTPVLHWPHLPPKFLPLTFANIQYVKHASTVF